MNTGSIKLRPILLGLAVFLSQSSFADSCLNDEVVPDRELLVRSPLVLDHENARRDGPLSFSSSWKKFSWVDPEKTIESWIRSWSKDQLVNGFLIQARSVYDLFRVWPIQNGSPDLEQAPFNLAAIVFRPDLKREGVSGGEARLVYNLMDPALGIPIEFMGIFEFVLPKEDRAFFKTLHSMRCLPSEDYSRVLSELFSNLEPIQVKFRTNDFFLTDLWELREFAIDQVSNEVKPIPLAETPHSDFNSTRSDELLRWVGENQESILSEKSSLPVQYLSGVAVAPNEAFGWLKNKELPPSLRKSFSIRSCNGCHSGDTDTRFTHIHPRYPGATTEVSQYLIQDLERRKESLESLLGAKASVASDSIYLRTH